MAAVALYVATVPLSWASAPEQGDDAAGRGLQLLRARETALGNQTVQATEAARRRGRMLYRLLLHEDATRRNGGPGQSSGGERPAEPAGGRAIALGVAVLARDLDEAATLRQELERVREERRSAVAAAEVMAPGHDAAPVTQNAAVRLRPPVAGPIVAPWGVARDDATGAWSFRTAAGYAPRPGAAVSAPAEGRIVRVEDEGGGGRALVLVHPGGVTTVLSGLATVAVAPHELVRAGALLGTAGTTVRLEAWRGRTSVDPASLMVASAGRAAKAAVARAPAPAR